jgi:hypothetical protein
VEDPESLVIRVEVKVFQSGKWIPGVITKIQKTKEVVKGRIIGPRINAWHKAHSTSVQRPA